MHVETATMSDLFPILENMVQVHTAGHEYTSSALLYGILRESPSLWCGEFNTEFVEDDEAKGETSLVEVVRGLSLKDE